MECEAVHGTQWCDTRDMTVYGHTKGGIDRDILLQIMGGIQSFKHDFKSHTPYRAAQTSRSVAA
eukprot:8675267-Pyramimonas_sp.AAC.1